MSMLGIGDNIGAETATHICESQAALPAELWYTILADVLSDAIHYALNQEELAYFGKSVRRLLLISKKFKDITKQILSIAFGLNLDSDCVLPMAVHAINSFIDWKGSAQILRSPTMPYMDVIRSPLLEAYSRYFTGTFWVRGASVRPKEMFARTLGPGEGLYDALQLCRRKIVPREFCQLLLDDVVQGLEYAQLVNILVDTGHQIIKLLMVHAEISNSADPDTGKLLQWMQELQPHLLRIENCEAEAADMLRQVGIMNPQTMVTQRIVDDLCLEDMLYILRPKILTGHGEAEQWLDRITQRWGHLMQHSDAWMVDL